MPKPPSDLLDMQVMRDLAHDISRAVGKYFNYLE
jgi:hypothetical protein